MTSSSAIREYLNELFLRIFSAPVAFFHARQICFPRTATRRVCTIMSDPSTDTVTTLSVLILFSLSASAANSPPQKPSERSPRPGSVPAPSCFHPLCLERSPRSIGCLA